MVGITQKTLLTAWSRFTGTVITVGLTGFCSTAVLTIVGVACGTRVMVG